MRITNKHGLDSTVVRAIKKSMALYSNGGADYSATTLLNPPRIVHLSRRHWNEIEVDAADLAWAFWGNLGHLALEKAAQGEAEQRLMIEVEGRKISGQVDHYHAGIINDYKFTKAKSLSYTEKILEWSVQLNVYAEIFRRHGKEVKGAKIHAFLKDWDEYRAMRERGYPQFFIQTIPILVWTQDRVDKELTSRVLRLKREENTPDDTLPVCTPEERWERGKAWAVKKLGGKRAVAGGVHSTLDDAKAFADCCDFPVEIEERKGQSLRCDRYCIVRNFCNAHSQE